MNRWPKKSRYTVLALVVTLGLAQAQAQAQRLNLTLAVVATLSGDSASIGEDTRDGALLCFEQYRNELRTRGVTLSVKVFDDRGNENGAREVASQLVGTPNIFAAVGYNVSGNVLLSMEGFEKAGLAYGVLTTSKRLTENGAKGIVRIVTRDDFLGEATARYIAGTLGGKSVFLVHDNTQNGISKAKELAEEIKKYNVAIVGLLGTDKEAEVPGLVKQIKTSNTQIVFYSGYLNIGAALALELEREKVTSTLVGTNTLDTPGFFQAAGSSAKGVQYASVGIPARFYPDGGSGFARRFQKRYGKEPGYRAAAACDATRAVLLALQTSLKDGAPYNRAVVQTSLRASNFAGITGVVQFDAKGDRTKQNIYIFKVGDDLIPRVVSSLSK